MIKPTIIAFGVVVLASMAFAHEGHDHSKDEAKTKQEAKHDHAKEKTPNGGRLIHSVTPHAEFLVTAERKVEIRFLDGEKVMAPAGQQVTVITGSRANPTRLSFTAEGEKLVSSEVLPEGGELPVVLQIKIDENAKTVTERFTLNLAQCPTCEHQEYACICEHGASGHSHGDGHTHKH